MEDLRALRSQGGWEELLNSAKSIRPSERNVEWQGLVTEAATNYLEQNKNKTYSGYSPNDLVEMYPFLAQSMNFSNTSNDVVMSEMEDCIQNSDRNWGVDGCISDYKDKADSVRPETAMKVAQFMSGIVFKAQVAPYYEIAVKNGGTQYCSDAGLQAAVVEGLTSPSYHDDAASARNVAFRLCKNEMVKAVEAGKVKETANYSQRTRHYMQNYCVFNASNPECVKGDF
jgi:hypothetical protein